MDIKEKIAKVARENNIEPAALLAVKQVESGNTNGFYSDGRPVILFEGHIFYSNLKIKLSDIDLQMLMRKYPTLIYPTWTNKYYRRGIAECERLQIASIIDRESALMSCSWGLSQIMGFNYKQCGCNNIQDFVNKMYESEESQIQLWINFLKSGSYLDKIKSHDWAGFARAYNGPGYKKNKYDEKLATNYEKFKKEFPA